jgi:histone-lysine N-methyltransferase EZH2
MAGIQGVDDGDFLDRTEPLDDFQQSFSGRTADIKQLGTSVYRDCWNEFYRWEPGECQQLIADLPPNSSDLGDIQIEDLDVTDRSWEQGVIMDADAPMPEIFMTLTTYSRDGSFYQARVTFDKVTVIAALVPHPTYESCPATSKNIARRFDEPNGYESVFIPYADEEDFDAFEYAIRCDKFMWQVDWRDPDRKTLFSATSLAPCID